MEKALFQSVEVRALLFFMHKMGCLLPKQTLAVCLWVLCHQQLPSWGGFTGHVVSDNKSGLQCEHGHYDSVLLPVNGTTE